MKMIKNGSLLTPSGFCAGSSYCGLKSDENDLDIALLTSETDLGAAGIFTQNRFAAAPVLWCRSILPADNLRAIVVNSGNANACTGEKGEHDAVQMAETVASLCGCRHEQVAVASTGVIGENLPMQKVTQGIKDAYRSLSPAQDAARKAEHAIMTTDTRPKSCAVQVETDQGVFSIGGMAKGSGMIAPHMATMLAFITTDISAKASDLQNIMSSCANKTFNCITVDGDTSTNDSVFVLASGNSNISLKGDTHRETFSSALHAVMHNLALQLVSDGEGATKIIEVTVSGAQNVREADIAARAIAGSLLVKCAINGEDPNWGRVVCAAGYSGAHFSPKDVNLFIGDTQVVAGGTPTGADAEAELKSEAVKLAIDLGKGTSEATCWTCDMSSEYVAINADYHT